MQQRSLLSRAITPFSFDEIKLTKKEMSTTQHKNRKAPKKVSHTFSPMNSATLLEFRIRQKRLYFQTTVVVVLRTVALSLQAVTHAPVEHQRPTEQRAQRNYIIFIMSKFTTSQHPLLLCLKIQK